MDFDRLPRRMLSSWVPAPRPHGAPKMRYGRTVFKAIDKFSISHAMWPQLAADRLAWRQTLQQGFPPQPFRQQLPAPLPPPLALTRPRRPAALVANYTTNNYAVSAPKQR